MITRRSAARSVEQQAPEDNIALKVEHGRLAAQDVLHLQRLLGNQAATGLITQGENATPTIQRVDELAGASQEKLLEEIKAAVEKAGKKKKPGSFGHKDLHEYEQTGKLKMHKFSAIVTSEPRFFAKKLAALKRGDRITVMGLKGSWCRVKTDDGKLGWMHRNYLIPMIMPDPDSSSRDKKDVGGHTRDEIVIGGRG